MVILYRLFDILYVFIYDLCGKLLVVVGKYRFIEKLI